MLLAIDESGERISPYKGGVAKCSICNSKVIAVCGIINIHHWRHEINPNCDPWQEHETEWHRSWKNEFPKDWQEIVVKENDEIHRADVKTPNGLVLELQNSSILAPIIQEREAFYKNMIWLINADSFKDNFEIYSKVNSKLDEIKNYYKQYDYSSSNWYVNSLEEELASLIPERDRLIRMVDSKESLFINYSMDLDNFDFVFSKTMSINNQHGNFTHENQHIQEIKEYKANLQLRKTDKENINKKIKLIQSFEFAKINGYEKYRYVDFKLVNASSFNKCKVVKIDSINQLFPEIVSINSELSFNSYSNRRDVLLLMNLEDDLRNCFEKCIEYNGRISNLHYLINQKTEDVKTELEKYLKEKTEKYKIEFERAKNELSNIQFRIESKATEIHTVHEEIENSNKELREQHLKEKIDKEIAAKKKLKGQYVYHWKHKRKSWDFSKNKLFLDFDTHIFQIKSNTNLVKMSKEEFIEMVKNWNR